MFINFVFYRWTNDKFLLCGDSGAASEGGNVGFGFLTGPLANVKGSCVAYSHTLAVIKIDRNTLAAIFIDGFAW